jgi:hypothetical protein
VLYFSKGSGSNGVNTVYFVDTTASACPTGVGIPAAFPFGIWFADSRTLYIADEGDGFTGGADLYTHAAAQTTAGLQKWVFDVPTAQWKLAYVINAGLEPGRPYQVHGYPSGNNAATGLPWAPATDGLRNITGRVDRDGTVFIWGITSTVSGNGDTGADPNRPVVVLDQLKNTDSSKTSHEGFVTLRTAALARPCAESPSLPEPMRRAFRMRN